MSALLLPDDNEALAGMVQDLLLQLAAERARAEAAEAKLALVDRYGAAQWRRGRDQDPQDFAEWQREIEKGEVQP